MTRFHLANKKNKKYADKMTIKIFEHPDSYRDHVAKKIKN